MFLIGLIPLCLAILGYLVSMLATTKGDFKKFFEKAEGQSVEAVANIKTVKSLGAEKFE